MRPRGAGVLSKTLVVAYAVHETGRREVMSISGAGHGLQYRPYDIEWAPTTSIPPSPYISEATGGLTSDSSGSLNI